MVFTRIAYVNGLKYNLISVSQLRDAKYIVQFDDRRGTIFNANKEVVLIAPRRDDVYVLDMSSLTQNGTCLFSKASETINWLWHKRTKFWASHPWCIPQTSLVLLVKKENTTGHHSKPNKPFSIKSCLHLLHMDLFGPVSPMSIHHEKYTLVIVDEYSRYTWVYFLTKKSQAAETIMSFVRNIENQNDVKVKQIRTDNGTEFKNQDLECFCDEKGISQNFTSPYTPEQNGVVEKKNRTLIEAARTMLNDSVLSKHFWTEAVKTACYTQNRSIIVKRHNKTPYEIFKGRIPDINYFHVFGCPVFIHNHKDHLGKFDAKADDGYFLGYSLVSKAFRVFNKGDSKLRKLITLLLMRALKPSGSPIPQLMKLVLMTHQGILLMSIILRTTPQPNTKVMLTSPITSSLITYPNHPSVSSLKLIKSQMRLQPLNKLFRNHLNKLFPQMSLKHILMSYLMFLSLNLIRLLQAQIPIPNPRIAGKDLKLLNL
jgi:transposase InsO family protein